MAMLLPQLWQWQWQWELLLALLPVVVFLVVITRGSSKNGRLLLPPGPARMPVLGNLHKLGRLPHRSLQELARRHGPVMLLRLGTVWTVVVSSAEAAEEVMKTHDVECCSRPASPGPKRLSYDLKNLGFAPYGEYWREMRRLFVVELLSMRRVKAARYAREQHVAKLVGDLTRLGRNRQPVVLNEHIFGLTDGIIGTVAFGNVYGADQFATHKRGRFQEVLDEAMEMMASFSAEDFFPGAAGRLVDRLTGLLARREKIFEELDAFFEVIIEQHLDPKRDNKAGADLVDVLIGLWKENQGGTLRFTKDHVKAIVLDAFIGAIDTSSVTMLWTMSELIRNPRVLRKVQDEIRGIVGSHKGGVTQDDVPKLSYLKMVVKETLRLHPPATLLVPRETMQAVQIGGYDVPAKTRILVNAWAIGRDPASWSPDPEEYNPDRFQASDVDFNGAHFQLIPFGAGRRICPGLAMGVMNVEFTLANLLYCFDWALPEGLTVENMSMEEVGKLIYRRKAPLELVPTPHT